MGSAAAARQQRWRERQKEGKSCLLIEVDDVAITAMLSDPAIPNNFLPNDAPTREELADAVSSFLREYVTRYTKERWPDLD